MTRFKRRRSDDADEDWLTTYADAVTLILCFFVVIISISEPKKDRFEEVRKAFLETEEFTFEEPFELLQQNIETMILEKGLGESMSVEETDDGLIVDIASSSFYEPASAKFKPEAVPVLIDLSVIIKEFDYDDYMIEVEGHTDDVPMQEGAYYPTNWELSGARATGVVRFFIEEGLSRDRMLGKAYADTQPKVPNIDGYGNPIPENRELNRRIGIRVERQE